MTVFVSHHVTIFTNVYIRAIEGKEEYNAHFVIGIIPMTKLKIFIKIFIAIFHSYIIVNNFIISKYDVIYFHPIKYIFYGYRLI
jgi:hypothetical protein